MKVLAPTLVGQTISYWEGDRDLRQGLVKAADVRARPLRQPVH